jgi:hypothetical protein
LSSHSKKLHCRWRWLSTAPACPSCRMACSHPDMLLGDCPCCEQGAPYCPKKAQTDAMLGV